MNGIVDVFVYGTLMVGEANHRIAAPYVVSVEQGTVRGRMYDAGDYPALVIDPGGIIVEGEWLTVEAEALAAMDELEDYRGPGADNDYDRVWISDVSGKRSGWVYVWHDSRGCPEIKCGSWRKHRR